MSGTEVLVSEENAMTGSGMVTETRCCVFVVDVSVERSASAAAAIPARM